MQERIREDRHLIILDLVDHGSQLAFLPSLRVLAESAEVQLFPSFGDVARDKPRRRLDPAVPGEVRIVAVAVVTGCLQNGLYVLRRFMCPEKIRFGYGAVSFEGRGYELDRSKAGDERKDQQLRDEADRGSSFHSSADAIPAVRFNRWFRKARTGEAGKSLRRYSAPNSLFKSAMSSVRTSRCSF